MFIRRELVRSNIPLQLGYIGALKEFQRKIKNGVGCQKLRGYVEQKIQSGRLKQSHIWNMKIYNHELIQNLRVMLNYILPQTVNSRKQLRVCSAE